MPRKAKLPAPMVESPVAPPLKQLSVEKIQALDEIQPRTYLSQEVIHEYATLYQEAQEIGDNDPLPEIHVFQIAGRYYVADGFHRLCAAKEAGRKTLDCYVHTGDMHDAMRYGIFANLRRGLAYTQADRQRILERLVQDPVASQRSDRSLAQELGLSHVTVGRARHRLAAMTVLTDEWQGLPVAQTATEPVDQKKVATLLQVAPEVVAQYEQIQRRPIGQAEVITRIARAMTDENLPVEEAKVRLRAQMELAVSEKATQEALARKVHARTEKARTSRAATQQQKYREAEREQRERFLTDHLQAFVEFDFGYDSGFWDWDFNASEDVPVSTMVAALSPVRREELPLLIRQAEALLQAIKDALGQPCGAE